MYGTTKAIVRNTDERLTYLRAHEDAAWSAYAEACWDPLATAESRSELFTAALTAMTAVLHCKPT